MISYLSGKVILKREKFIILDVQGVGYKVFLSRKSILKVPETGQVFKIFCFLQVKENSLELYGFLNPEELEFFEVLDSISGIGPKAALEIASLGPLGKLKNKILSQDQNIFEGIAGIGRKKAMAIMLELSGKIKEISKPQKPKKEDEALSALIRLGFSKQRSQEALKNVSEDIKNTEQRMKQALKILGGN